MSNLFKDEIRIKGDLAVLGEGEGPVISTDVPLSLWGGYDPSNGRVIDQYHPLHGECITNKIFVLPKGKGSSSGSGVLLEAITAGNAPSGIILSEKDEIIILGGVVSYEVFQKEIPIVVLNEDAFEKALKSSYAKIEKDGSVTLTQ